MFWNQLLAIAFVFGLLLLTSFLLNKFLFRIPTFLKGIIKFVIYIISFIVFFVLFRTENNVYLFFSVSIIVVTYLNIYVSLIFKKLDFGEDNNYRNEMLIFLLLILISLFQGEDILDLGGGISNAMNSIWMTILAEQILNQLIVNNKVLKKK